MADAVIVAAARTPIGTARKGTLVDVSAFDLAKYAVGETLKRSGIPHTDVDDLQMGESLQGGGDIARYTAVDLGIEEVPGLALNRHCASGMASVQGSAASIIAGMDKVIIAGGAESLSSMPMVNKRVLGTDDWAQWMSPSHPETPDAPAFDMSITVGYNTAKAVGLTREDCDAWAVRSHARAIAAIDEGRLQEEIVPIEVTLRDGTTKIFDTDEHPRRGSSMETLAALKTLLGNAGPLQEIAGEASQAIWRDVRDVRAFADGSEKPVWRVSMTPSQGHRMVLALRMQAAVSAFYDWQGGLVWLRMEEGDPQAALLRGLLRKHGGGHATLVRAPVAVRAP